jgi:hypothetical protein
MNDDACGWGVNNASVLSVVGCTSSVAAGKLVDQSPIRTAYHEHSSLYLEEGALHSQKVNQSWGRLGDGLRGWRRGWSKGCLQRR